MSRSGPCSENDATRSGSADESRGELSAAAIAPEYKEVVAFAILVLVMVLRPQGLLAKRGALAAAG